MPLHSKQVPISSKNSHAARSAHAKAKQEIKTYDTSALKQKRSVTPFVIIGIVVVAIICIVVACILSGCSNAQSTLPKGEKATIEVVSGASAKEVADILYKAKLIATTDAFLDVAKSSGYASSIKPGTYEFEGGMTPMAILTALANGPLALGDSLAIPEGYTIKRIAAALEEATSGRIAAKDFIAATSDASVYAADYAFLTEAGTNSLEGFLFPKTYIVSNDADAVAVVRMMLDQYALETKGVDWSYAEAQGLSKYEALILASIVEKESNSENMPTVASVFYNRLASDRPYLESDATTAYEVGQDPTPEQVHANTPYSTYSNPGVPPTPICNPSLKAIKAVCSPEKTNYMFFYFDDKNGYSFSETYEEHQSSFS